MVMNLNNLLYHNFYTTIIVNEIFHKHFTFLFFFQHFILIIILINSKYKFYSYTKTSSGIEKFVLIGYWILQFLLFYTIYSTLLPLNGTSPKSLIIIKNKLQLIK